MVPVPTSLDALQAEVLPLSASERARLLERVILRLDAYAEAACDALAAAREAELTLGVLAGVRLDDAIARLEARFKV